MKSFSLKLIYITTLLSIGIIGFAQDANLITPDPSAVCPGDNVSFTVNFTGVMPYSLNYTYDGTPYVDNNIMVASKIYTVAAATTTGDIVLTAMSDNTGPGVFIDDRMIITIDLPQTNLTINNTNICDAGNAIITIVLSEPGVSYQLREDIGDVPVGAPIIGTGGNISFPAVSPGITTTYNILATSATAACDLEMNTKPVVYVNTTPNITLVVNDDEFCDGDVLGGAVEIIAGEANTNYELRLDSDDSYVNHVTNVAAGNVSIGDVPAATTTYNIYATRTDGSGCAAELNARPVITVNPLPTDTYIVGDPNVCDGDAVNISISGSQNQTTYELFNALAVSQGTQAGTGAAININATPGASGTYYVIATDDNTLCSDELTDKSIITVESVPDATLAVNDPAVCDGEDAVITVAASELNTNYQLRRDADDFVLNTLAGTGADLDFTQSPGVAGDYNIYAIRTVGNFCAAELTNLSTVTVNPLPVNKVITATDYCADALGGTITVPLAEIGVSYQIYTVPGAVAYGAPQIGAGVDLTWNNVTAGDYMIVATTGSSCTRDLNTVTVTQNPIPNPNPTSSDADDRICEGTSVTLNAGDLTGVSWAWDNAGTLNNANIQGPIATPLAPTTYTVTVTNAFGCQNTGSITINVDSKPTININDDQGNTFTICEGEDIILTGTSTNSIAVWSWSTGDNTQSTTVSPTLTTPYTLDITDVNGCTNSKIQNVTVNDRPTANAGSDEIMCLGVGVTLTATVTDGTPGYTYAWSDGGGAASTTVNPLNDATYTVTVTDANLCSHTDDVFVDVVENPTVDAGVDQSICHGDVANLVATPGVSGLAPFDYTWLPGGLSGSSVNVSPTNVVYDAAPIVYAYTVTIEDQNGCIANDLVNVTVNSLSSLTIANDGATYCQDAGLIPLIATPVGGVWSDVSTPGFIQAGDNIDPANPPTTPGTYTIRYTYTNTNSCVSMQDATVEILPYETPNPTDLIIDNESDYCHTDGATYNITGVLTPDISGMTGVTEVISGPAGVIDDGSGNGIGTFIPSVLGQGTHTITYTITTPGCNATYTENINVGLPVTITAPTDMCVGDADQALVADDITGDWTITFTDDATGTPTTIGPIPYGDPAAVLQATQPGTYDISYEVSNAGIACVNSTTATCVVHGLPDLTFTIGTFDHDDLDINFCTNDIQAILVGYDGGALAGGGIFSGAGVTAAQFDPATGTGSYNITYDFTDANGCSNTVVSNNVQVNLAPTVDITGLDPDYCENAAVFTVTGDPISGTGGPGTFTFPALWGPPGDEYTDPGDGTATIDPSQITPTGTYSLDYTVTDLNGCSGTVTEFFDVNPLPTVDFNGIPASGEICKNASPIILTGSPTTGDGIFTGDGITNTMPLDGTATFDPSAETVGTHDITYTWTDPVTGCVNSITKSINVLPLPATYAVTAPGGLDYCSSLAGITIGVSNSEDATNTYHLIQNGITTVESLPGSAAAFNFANSYPAGDYTVIAENSDGCQATFGNTVTPIEHPAIADAGSVVGQANVCADGTTLYTYSVPTIANATDHVWIIPANVTIDTDNDDEIIVIFDNAFVAGDFEVYGTDPTSVCPDGNNNTITVNAIPEPVNVGATIVGSDVVCEEETGKVYSIDPADFTNETSFEWEITAGTAVITSTTTASSITVDYLTGSLTGTIRVRAVNACGVSTWVSQAITVNPVPDVSINALGAGNVITCDPASQVQLNAASTENPLNITAWQWTASNGGIIVPGEENNINPNVTHEGDFEVQIEVTTNGLACYNTATITVGADKVAPVATIDPHGVLDCNNITLSLQANSTTPSTYAWTFTPPANITVGANTDNPTIDAPGTYTVEVTDLSNSCTGSASTTVTENVTSPNISVTDPAADELTCIVNTVDVEGNSTTPGATYQWSTLVGGATITNPANPTAIVDMAGLYTLVVTDPANGCTSTLDVTVNEDVSIPVITSLTNNDGSDLTCSNTTVQLEASVAAVPTATFAWNTGTGTIDATSGAFNQFAEVSAAADYSVVATNPANGCQSLASTITVGETLTTATTTGITPSETELTCTNGSTVTLTANITGDAGGSYLWTTVAGTIVPPATAASVDVTAAGTYTLHYYHSVTGCESTASVVITDNTASPTVAINPGPYSIICTDLTPTLTATGDIDPLTTYLWSGPGAIGTPTNLSTTVDATGTYTITATGTNGCTSTSSVGVTQNLTVPNISVTDPATDDLTCIVNTVDVEGNSTTPGATYQWSTLVGGATITNPANPTAIVDMAGLYTLVVTDPANGCTSTLDVTVNEDVSIPVITSLTNNDGSDLTCSNTTVELEASVAAVPTATFAWNTGTGTIDATSGAFNQFAEVSAAADYSVVATNPANGCQSLASTITVGETLTTATTTGITPSETELTCTNGSTVTLTANITGDAGGSYLWTTVAGTIVPPATAASVDVTAAGTYTLHYYHSVTGCESTASVVITDNTASPTVAINPGPYSIICTDLTPTLTATGDIDPLTTYLWSGPGTIGTPTNLSTTVDATGTYTITATGTNGCTSTSSVGVTQDLTVPNISVTDPATDDLTCIVNTVDVEGNSTTPGATYQWSTLVGGATITNPANPTAIVDMAGLYTLVVTDPANGCTSTLDVTVNEDVAIPVITSLTNNDGSDLACNNTTVELEASVASVPNATFVWNTGTGTIDATSGAFTQFAEVSDPADYTVTATNPDNGCESSATITVNEDLSTPTINIAAPGQVTCTNTVDLDATGSVNATNYSWMATLGGNISANANTATPTVNAAGRYTVTAEHITTGCTASDFVDVTEDNSVPVIDVFDINPGEILCNNPTVSLSGDATTIANKTIQWTTVDGNFTTVTDISNPTVDQGGTYTVTITNDDNGCQAVRGVTVSERTTAPTITIDVPLDFTCSRTEVNLDATGTSADLSPVSYVWTAGAGGNIVSGATTATVIVDAMATYTVEVTDLGNGCVNTNNVTTTEDITPPDVSVDTNPDQITCDDAMVILNGSSVYPNVSYLWTTSGAGTITNATTTTPTVDAIGTYNLTVENLDNNCTSTSANVIVTEDVTAPVVVPAVPSGDITCSVTEVNISVSQVVGYSYSWSGPGNIVTPNSYSTNVNAGGTYSVVVEDINNGCTDTYTVDVTEDITPAASPIINDIETCFGTANPSFNVISGTNVNWYGNLGLTVYLGNGNTYTPTITTVGTHSYYATSTGANGCESLPTEIIFTIYDLPAAPATVDNAICEGEAAAQLTAVGTNINWYDNTSTFLIGSSTYTPADVLAGTYTYYATQTDANGCESAQEPATYVINSVPGVPVFTDASIEVCETETNPSFTVVGNSINWYKTIGGAVVSSGNTHQPDEVLPGNYLYYATQTENGCESAEATGDITINPIPIEYNVTGGGSYCEGGLGIVVGLANSEIDVNYELWLDDATLINDLAGTGAALDFGNQLAAGDYTIYGYKTATSCRIKMNGGVTISINPLPAGAGTITGSSEVCQNETSVVYTVAPIANATDYIWTIPAGFTIVSGANSNSITVDVDNTALDGTISVYGENACGTGNISADFLVTVNPIPVSIINIVGSNTICNDDDGVVYTVDQDLNATQYNWTLPQGATVVAGANSRQVTLDFDNTAVSDDIVVAAANACGEGPAATLSITVNEIPYVFAGDQQDLCADNTILEGNVPAAGIGTWSTFSGAATITNPNDPVSSVTSIGEGINELVWSITANGCTMNDTVTITNNTVYVEAGDNKTICNESLILEGNSVPGGATGSWSAMIGAASFASGSSPNTTATNFSNGINILKWTITKNGCTSYDSVIIDNQRPSNAYSGIDISVCGDTVQLDADEPGIGTGLWTVVTGSASFENNNEYNTIARGLNKGNNTLRWTITNGICSLSDEIVVTNNQVDINAGIDQILCDRTTTLDATAATIGIGYWSVVDGSGVFVDQNDPKTTVTGLEPNDNNLAWNINNNGCITTDTIKITNNEPTEPDAGPDQSISATSTTLAANTPAEGTGQWTLVSGSGNIADINSPNTNVTDLGSGENYFRWTITKNSCTSFDDVIVTNFMSISTDAGDDQTICSDEAILNGNEPVFGFGEWSVIQGTALFDDYTSFNTRVTGLASGDNILQWGVWENGWTYDEVIITYDEPTVANAGSDQTLCDDSTNLAANDPIVGKGVWTILSGSAVFEDDSAYNTIVTDLAKGENIFKWTITNKSCSSSDQVSIINNLPTDAYAGSDQTICEDSTTLNPNTPSVGIGEWSVIAGAGNFSGNQVSSLAADTNILRWTISTTGCAVYDEITIVNNKPSEANAGGDKILCGDSIDLAASLPQEGSAVWTIQNGSAIIDDDLSPTTKVTDLGIGINIFRWTVTKNGCVQYDEVTVKNSFIEAIVGDDQVLCDETTVLEANNPLEGTGTWSILGGSGSANFDDLHEPDTRVTDLDKGVNTLRWTIENDICISFDDVVITNNLPTEAFAGADRALCSDNTTLAGNTPITGIGEWSILSGSANIISPDNPTSNVTNLDYGVNTLRWTITNNGCTSTDEVVIANNSTVASDAGIDQAICTDSTVLYGNEPPFGTGQWYVYSGSAVFENNYEYNSKITDIGQGQNILRWSITNGECSSVDEVIITNNSPTVAIAGDDQIICGANTNLLANVPSIGTGEWSLVSGAAMFTEAFSNSTTVTGINPGNNTLRWTITNNGCSSSDELVITNDLPKEANAGLDIVVCEPEAGLYANNPGTGTGQWTILSGSGSFENSTQFDSDIINLGFGVNTLQWTITYDHCTTKDEVTVINNKIELNAGENQTVNESSTLLAASNPSTGSGQWSVIGGTGVFDSPSSSITTVSELGSGLNTFRWSVDIGGCISYDDVSVTYNVPPVASFVVTASEGCPPLEVYFVNNSLAGLPFVWDFNDGTTSDQVSFKHTYNEPGTYKPSLTVTGENGEIVTRDTTITVYPQPQASFVVVNKEVYIPEEEAIFINESSDAATYLWDFGDGNTSTETDPKHIYESAGFYDVELQVWSEYDCYNGIKVLEALEVIESGQVIFPNAFTPNLDGSSGGVYNPNDFSNDVFYPIGEGLENYHLEVFNRWGALVFESKDINIGWDGYYDGKLLDEGVYVWKVTGKYNNGKDFKKVGTVMLLH